MIRTRTQPAILAALVAATALPTVLRADPPSGQGYSLVFADEFVGSSLDTMKWNYNYTWGNQHNHSAYMDPSQVKVGNGILNLQGIAQAQSNATDHNTTDFGWQTVNYTSGAINSNGKFNMNQGYIEARMKMPNVVGSWPAFWLLQNGWPPEIDVMEFVLASSGSNSSPNRHHGYYHYTNNGSNASFGSAWTEAANLTSGYHTYGLGWTGSAMTFYYDGAAKGSWTNSAAIAQSTNMYLILNNAIGGWAGTPAGNSAFPSNFETDWVRVWQIRPGGSSTTSTWDVDGNGSWDTSGNWSGPVPEYGGQQVNLGRVGSASLAAVSWSNSRTVGAITFSGDVSGTTAYTIGSLGGSLQMASSGNATITASSTSTANQTINSRLDLWSPTVVQNNMTSSLLQLFGPIIGTTSLTIEGSGVTVLGGDNSFQGGVFIDSGTQGAAVVRTLHSNALGSGTVQFNTGGNNTTGRLEISKGRDATIIGNPINLTGRNNSEVAIDNINGDNALANTIYLSAGGGTYIIQSSAHTLTLSGAVNGTSIRSNATGNRLVTLQGTATGNADGRIENGNGTISVMKDGAGLWIFNANSTYSGTTTVNAGTLRVNGTHSGAGNYVVNSGGTLGGVGRIQLAAGASVTNDGTIAPGQSAGSLSIGGDYLQSASAVLSIELAGTGSTQFDKLNVTGSAALAGMVRVQAINGFIPLPGQSFEIVSYSSHTGSLSVVNSTGLDGLIIQATDSATALTLSMSALYAGDANLDGQVDINDLAALATSWQSSGNWLAGDFDGSGFIDINDLAALATNWQGGVDSPGGRFDQALASVTLGGSSVPEPLALAPLAAIAALFRRRRRSPLP